MQERGNLWVPVNINAAEYDPFKNEYNMTKSEKLFQEMEYRFTKEALKRRSEERSMSFLSSYKSFHEERRSRKSDFQPLQDHIHLAAATLLLPENFLPRVLQGG